MTGVYYEDDLVRLYHGDCLEITEWLSADVLVTDPPYGRAWKQGRIEGRGNGRRPSDASDLHEGIAGDVSTEARDAALELWGRRLAVVFGDLMFSPAMGTQQVGAYLKPSSAGVRGAVAGRRRDLEAIYWLGGWPSGMGGESSLLATRTANVATGPAARYGHPHAKPLDILEDLISSCPSGTIADPFAGSGSTLVAAKALGRKAIGVELEERYCEIAARRLAQDAFDFGGAA